MGWKFETSEIAHILIFDISVDLKLQLWNLSKGKFSSFIKMKLLKSVQNDFWKWMFSFISLYSTIYITQIFSDFCSSKHHVSSECNHKDWRKIQVKFAISSFFLREIILLKSYLIKQLPPLVIVGLFHCHTYRRVPNTLPCS